MTFKTNEDIRAQGSKVGGGNGQMETLDMEKVASNLNNSFTIKWVHLGAITIQGATKGFKLDFVKKL